MPLNISLTLMIFGRLFKKNKLVLLAIIILCLSSLGIISNFLWIYLENPWVRINLSELEKTHSIVVLSSSRFLPPGNSKVIEWYDPDRFFAGIELFNAGKSNKLIFTGGYNPYNKGLPPEGEIYKKEAMQMGIPINNIFLTNPVKNTEEEAKSLEALYKENNFYDKNIILVTSAFHMNRAIKTFEREGFTVTPYPVDFRTNKYLLKDQIRNPLNWLPKVGSLNRTSSALREILGRIIYNLKM